MGDSPPDDFTFSPSFSPAGWSPDQFMGFVASMTPEQRHLAQTYWQSAGPSVATTPGGPTPSGPTPLTTVPTTPADMSPSPSTGRRRRRSRTGSSGGGCCGSGGTDASTPPRERPALSSTDSTPYGSPRTPWGPHSYDHSKVYKVRDGAPVMDRVGKEMRARIRQLCTIQFGHAIMRPYTQHEEERRNYITQRILQEFRPAPGHPVVLSDWIQHTAMTCMAHRRSEARDAYRQGRPKPAWLDVEEWEEIGRDLTESPDRFRQQRDAAQSRLRSRGASHLGSGGYETLRSDFVSIFFIANSFFVPLFSNAYVFRCSIQEMAVGRPPSGREERYGHDHGLVVLLEQLEAEEGVTVNWDALP